ncbi:hypothetical protein [Bauldia litoralis]|uniref:Uncharacterized protein n=1 Tax=Bauldia litoralis TaxID=665467 RepID=A0A1G6A4G3_9HYPH|nr:hypothetical protein [Bauldia litoralis]SDB03319.1 hypothetical protein SAMN02982931_00164 [Bauldia litoralis]
MAKKSTTRTAVTADPKAGDKPDNGVEPATAGAPTPAKTEAAEAPAAVSNPKAEAQPESKLSSASPAAIPEAKAADKPADEREAKDAGPSPLSGATAAGIAIARARQNPLLNWLSSRAAMIAIAAGVGALIGTTVSNGISYTVSLASNDAGSGETTRALRSSVSQLTAEIASLKAMVAGNGIASLADDTPRLLGGAESARIQPAPKLAAVSDAPAGVSNEITGSIAAPSSPIAKGWTLWRVRNGRALVQGENGYFEVAPGSRLPGLGTVERIVRRGNDWSVETRNGVILPRS